MKSAGRRLRAAGCVGWQLVTAGAIAAGLTTVLRDSAGPAVTAWLIVAMIATTAWIIRDFDTEPDIRQAARVGAQCGGVAIASIGLIQLLDTAALAMIGVLVATSPHLLDRLSEQIERRRPPRPRTTKHVSFEQPVDLQPECKVNVSSSLTDEDLCLAWRSTYVALSRAATAESRIRTVEIRAVILDEIDRRNSQGLRSWLDSGARAASDPRRHLSEPPL